jgi:hypothetical protein
VLASKAAAGAKVSGEQWDEPKQIPAFPTPFTGTEFILLQPLLVDDHFGLRQLVVSVCVMGDQVKIAQFPCDGSVEIIATWSSPLINPFFRDDASITILHLPSRLMLGSRLDCDGMTPIDT